MLLESRDLTILAEKVRGPSLVHRILMPWSDVCIFSRSSCLVTIYCLALALRNAIEVYGSIHDVFRLGRVRSAVCTRIDVHDFANSCAQGTPMLCSDDGVENCWM